MKIKKNPDKDLSKYSLIFFQIGLIIALSFSLFMIERKTYKKDSIDTGVVNYNVLEQESVPITEMKSAPPPPPPPPAPMPEVIEIVDNDVDIQEVNIQSTETDQNESVDADALTNTGDGEVIGVGDVGDVEEEIDDIPFSVIEDVPIFPGCEGLTTNEERKKCMSEKVKLFTHENFNMKITRDLELSGIYKIFVQFKIDHRGSIVDIAARAPHPKLQEEGIRVVKMLPKMEPGKQRGRPVGVLYALPITIKIKEGF